MNQKNQKSENCIKYKVVKGVINGPRSIDISDLVNEYLEDGWELYGNMVFIENVVAGTSVAQAMIKH